MLLATAHASASTATYRFEGRSLAFTHVSHAAGAAAVGIDDPGLRSLLDRLGAVLTWHPGERYVLITTAQAVVISFSVGDRSYDVGPLSADASFAPYLVGSEVYLPFIDLMHALSLAPTRMGVDRVLQREITSIDVRGSGDQAILVARGAGSLEARVVRDDARHVEYEFAGFGSTLAGTRPVGSGGIRSLSVHVAGSAAKPDTFVTLELAPGARHDAPHSNNGDFEVAFGGGGSAPPLLANEGSAPTIAEAPVAGPPLAASQQIASPVYPGGEPSASPLPVPSGANAAQGPATVGAVSAQNTSNGAMVTIPVAGNAQFAWHRLRAPDNRFWIDISNANLSGGPVDQTEADPLISMRVRQNDPQTVRVALSLVGAQSIIVTPSATGITIAIGNEQVADAPRFGSGSVGTLVSSNEPQPLVTPVPADMYGENGSAQDSSWKFGGGSTYVPTNPRLIVIDPGHGGSDPGSERNGVTEASLTLDMAKRLQGILVARGWQVKMTRETDVDVYRPNDSAHDELQARDNIANASGGLLLVSIHVNAFINSGPSGTTTYYSKPIDVPLAQTVQNELASTLGTKNDGIIKSKLYVTLHAHMPAILIETAFISNPDDFAKLTSPDWRQKVALAIADGIDQYAQQHPVPSPAQ